MITLFPTKPWLKEALYSVLCFAGLLFVVQTGWITLLGGNLDPEIVLDWNIFLVLRKLGPIADFLEYVPLVTVLVLAVLSVYFGHRAIRSFRSKTSSTLVR